MLVSDRGLLAAGTVERVGEIASAAGVAVHRYTETAENPTTTNLEEIAALYRAQGCDGLVGLGGGSSLDAAKARVRADRERRQRSGTTADATSCRATGRP